jgi:hypothetical protein
MALCAPTAPESLGRQSDGGHQWYCFLMLWFHVQVTCEYDAHFQPADILGQHGPSIRPVAHGMVSDADNL